MIISIDSRNGTMNNENIFETEDFEKVFELVDRLDGNRHTLVSIEKSDGSQMLVGGGAGKYIVTMTSSDFKNFHLENGEKKGGLVEICAGGQFGEYDKNMVVSIDLVKSAIKQFFGRTTPNLSWVSD
ncbi:hypothetical protein J7370_05980 [Xanthomonas sp. D-93]|uniref:hypothetical protein n=2 Tax=Xanthomonas TaxID=338 RepID=UPI001ADCAA89|nr:hypothetical protein [Xanthomonas sp. D-93]MBO9872940.1 hypothetical protein [Xanthomonas sp. D-93]